MGRFFIWLDIIGSKFYDWQQCYGRSNQYNGRVPRRFWLEEWERMAIINFAQAHPDEGYRRLAFMMIDTDEVATSPSSVYRVLKQADMLNRWSRQQSNKGQGFHQPKKAHEHWHIDIAYINICGIISYLCGILDGYRRYIVNWDIHEQMTELMYR